MNFDSTLVRIPSSASTHTRPAPTPLEVKLIPRDKWAKFALIWSAVQLVLITSLELGIAIMHSNWTKAYKEGEINAKALTVYHGLFVASQGFQLYLCFDAVVQSSTIQLVSATVFNFALLLYSGLQFQQANNLLEAAERAAGSIPDHPTKSLEICIMTFMVIFCIGWLVISRQLWNVFGWSIFKELGADINVRKRLDLYHIYLTLLKLDVFFFVGFDLQFLILVLLESKDQTALIIHAGVAMPLTLALLVVAYVAVGDMSWTRVLTLVFIISDY